MSDVVFVRQPHRGKPAEERGDLDIRPKVFDKIIERATLAVPSVVKSGSAWKSLRGAGLPKIQAQVAAGSVRVAVEVAVQWPCDVAHVARSVHSAVAHQVSYMTGMHVDGVDVYVPALVREQSAAVTRRVQ